MYAVLYTKSLAITAWAAFSVGTSEHVEHMHMLRRLASQHAHTVFTLMNLVVYILPADAISCIWGS